MKTLIKNDDLFLFQYQGLHLKLLEPDDLIHTLAWRNNFKKWFNDDREITLECHLQWYESYLKKDDDYIFLIFNKDYPRLGQAGIYNIDSVNQSAEFGRFLVNPEFLGKGYMKQACNALLNFSKEYLKLKKIYLQVKEENKRAQAIYYDCGFKMKEILENKNIFMEKFL